MSGPQKESLPKRGYAGKGSPEKGDPDSPTRIAIHRDSVSQLRGLFRRRQPGLEAAGLNLRNDGRRELAGGRLSSPRKGGQTGPTAYYTPTLPDSRNGRSSLEV